MLFNQTQLWYDDRRSSSDRLDTNHTNGHGSPRLISPATTWYDNRRPSPPEAPAKQSSVSRLWRSIWSALTSKNDEPRVQQIRDRSGYLFWQVYDPVTNQTDVFDSENDVRVWIEQRYHQVPDTNL